MPTNPKNKSADLRGDAMAAMAQHIKGPRVPFDLSPLPEGFRKVAERNCSDRLRLGQEPLAALALAIGDAWMKSTAKQKLEAEAGVNAVLAKALDSEPRLRSFVAGIVSATCVDLNIKFVDGLDSLNRIEMLRGVVAGGGLKVGIEAQDIVESHVARAFVAEASEMVSTDDWASSLIAARGMAAQRANRMVFVRDPQAHTIATAELLVDGEIHFRVYACSCGHPEMSFMMTVAQAAERFRLNDIPDGLETLRIGIASISDTNARTALEQRRRALAEAFAAGSQLTSTARFVQDDENWIERAQGRGPFGDLHFNVGETWNMIVVQAFENARSRATSA